MKFIFLSIALLASLNTFAGNKLSCISIKAVQDGSNEMKSDVQLNFEIEKAGNNSVLKNAVGHVFVKSALENDEAKFSTDDSYMGFFKIDLLKANADYHPSKYKGYAQFKNFDATHTSGVEDGMWGYLSLDVTSNEKKINGVYVFQAGDHMGGTILLECRAE